MTADMDICHCIYCGLINYTLSNSRLYGLAWEVEYWTDNWKGRRCEWYSLIGGAPHPVKGIRETLSMCPSWDWKWAPPEYKVIVLLLESACLCILSVSGLMYDSVWWNYFADCTGTLPSWWHIVWIQYLHCLCSSEPGAGFRGNASFKEQDVPVSSLYFVGHMCCSQSGDSQYGSSTILDPEKYNIY